MAKRLTSALMNAISFGAGVALATVPQFVLMNLAATGNMR
jgi:hypothetical protein